MIHKSSKISANPPLCRDIKEATELEDGQPLPMAVRTKERSEVPNSYILFLVTDARNHNMWNLQSYSFIRIRTIEVELSGLLACNCGMQPDPPLKAPERNGLSNRTMMAALCRERQLDSGSFSSMWLCISGSPTLYMDKYGSLVCDNLHILFRVHSALHIKCAVLDHHVDIDSLAIRVSKSSATSNIHTTSPVLKNKRWIQIRTLIN